MDKRTTDIVCYCTWVGLLVAVLAGNREASRFHLNQSLVLGIFGLLGVIPCVGWVWAVFVGCGGAWALPGPSGAWSGRCRCWVASVSCFDASLYGACCGTIFIVDQCSTIRRKKPCLL